MELKIPEYGVNYDRGWVGFSRRQTLFSNGIVFFTRDEAEGLVPSHSFIVVDSTYLIEASAGGVHMTPLHKYFDDIRVQVFFKKPLGINEDKANRIVAEAMKWIGKGYDYSLMFSFIERYIIKKILGDELYKKVPSIWNAEDRVLCSELVSLALRAVPDYACMYPLDTYHTSKISPADLFNSSGLFKDWTFEE